MDPRRRPILDESALVALIDQRVEAKLASLGVAATTYGRANLPPGVTLRTFNRWCRTGRVANAQRDGAGWTCGVEAWRAARSKGPAPRATKATPANDHVNVNGMLAAAGLRPTARRAR